MRKLTNGMMGLTIVIGFSGCGTTWVNIDKTKATETNIKKAENKCQYWQKMKLINTDQNSRGYIISLSGATGKAKEQMIKINKEKKQKDYKVIYDCMKKEGFLKK